MDMEIIHEDVVWELVVREVSSCEQYSDVGVVSRAI